MNRWHARSGNENYSIELAATRIRFTKDSGTPDSFGGNDVPYPRFLRSEKWQSHVAQVFGAQILEEVLLAARARAQ
ncbi:hypothetical protein [Lysobacter enzymogenes]|uniref:hypothetical protein n=1 Tax=Lysobacter enzymogenes TaxID=69 RepID=UPI001A9597C4|nr:hypothetical protein [Lysobacter enzymogenes]QQP95315.1 hypothetical protein JHW38_19045 [Lysobacter enzymogenes]